MLRRHWLLVVLACSVAVSAQAQVAPRDSTLPVKLEPVTTVSSPLLTEFEQRRLQGMGGGQFLTRADFARRPERKFADFMTSVPGARLAHSGGQVWVTSGRGTSATLREPAARSRFERAGDSRRACYVDVWLNGVQVYGRTRNEMPFDINTIPAETIEGVEYYASGTLTPAQYQRFGAECGTLLIWLRQR